MLSRLKAILISVFLVITTTIQCSYTYFAIEQCPGTDVPNIRHQIKFNEISIIFYYTQWSDESLEALQQYNDVAEHFGDKVYFAAVNCWHLACNCSRTLTTPVGSGSPHKWPTLMVHYGREGQLKIQYNGLYTFRDMVQFIGNVMQPLERVESRRDLDKMRPLSDAIILGVFESPEDMQYKQYLKAALKWLEHDPIRTYQFTVTFTRIKEGVNDTNVKVPNLLLQGHKAKKSYADYTGFKWNTTNILQWLQEELNDDYSQLYGYTTPIMIAQRMKKQPVMAIFVNEPQQFYAYMEKYVDPKRPHTTTALNCKKLTKNKALKSKWKNSIHVSKALQEIRIFSDSSRCHYYIKDILLKKLNLYYEINEYLHELYKQLAFPASLRSIYNPSIEMQDNLDFFQKTQCVLKKDLALETTLKISTAKRLESYLRNEQHNLNSNRTLTALLLDTQRYRDYLESLAIPRTVQSMATVFIVDNEKENIYVMEDRFAMFNLMEFVKKYYTSGIYNYYKNNENIPHSLSRSASSSEFDLELKHLNRHVFLNYLQHTHNQTLIVLIYSPDCALCGNIQHTFMQLSLTLRHIMELKFIRINAMENDLPWQYNMPFLPGLLVFPENRFAESRLFPMELKPNLRNVLGFILSQLNGQQQVKLVLAICQSGTLPTGHAQSCWQFAKTILMQHIGKHLHYWQMFEAERSIIFERLRAFKDMSLDVQRNLRL